MGYACFFILLFLSKKLVPIVKKHGRSRPISFWSTFLNLQGSNYPMVTPEWHLGTSFRFDPDWNRNPGKIGNFVFFIFFSSLGFLMHAYTILLTKLTYTNRKIGFGGKRLETVEKYGVHRKILFLSFGQFRSLTLLTPASPVSVTARRYMIFLCWTDWWSTKNPNTGP